MLAYHEPSTKQRWMLQVLEPWIDLPEGYCQDWCQHRQVFLSSSQVARFSSSGSRDLGAFHTDVVRAEPATQRISHPWRSLWIWISDYMYHASCWFTHTHKEETKRYMKLVLFPDREIPPIAKSFPETEFFSAIFNIINYRGLSVAPWWQNYKLPTVNEFPQITIFFPPPPQSFVITRLHYNSFFKNW